MTERGNYPHFYELKCSFFFVLIQKMTLYFFLCFSGIFLNIMNIKLKDIGARIERVIKDKDISRAQLGELLGLGEGAIGRHIRGETDPGTIALAKIAELGGITLDELITGKPPTAEILMNSLEPEEMNKLRGTFSPGPMGAITVRDYSGAIAGPQCAENAQTNGIEQFILGAIKAADSETVGAVMELLIKRREKPEGRNGTEG